MSDRHELLDDVLAQLQDGGLAPDTPLALDKRTRCATVADKGNAKNGWYVVYEHRLANGDTAYFGSFGDWRSGEKGSWSKLKPCGGRLTDEDRKVMKARTEAAKKKADADRAGLASKAARRAAGLWKVQPEKGRSAYLERKQVVGFGVRYGRKGGTALVPMHDVKDRMVGMQILFDEPDEHGLTKKYWPYGLAKDGAFHLIGPHPEPGEPLVICEGYATGASLHMATGLCVAVAFDAGNLMPVAEAMRERFAGRPIILCADDDWKTEINGKPFNTGVEKARNAADVVGGQVVAPLFDTDRQDKWTDFNDLHCAEGLDAVRRQVMAVVRPSAEGGWRKQLHRTNTGALVPHVVNVAMVLANDERWAGVIAEDIFSSKTIKRRTTPYGGQAGEWSDLDDTRTAIWLAEQYGLRVKALMVLEAVAVVAHDNQYHPVREYLAGLEWDGVKRLDGWLEHYLGAKPLADNPEYVAIAGRRWMLSAIARVMRPGVKADCVLILEGAQGEGKSSALKVLGGDWFMDSPFPLGDKEAFQQIRGKWIVELGELDAFNKAESTKAKQFFSASVDTFRASYARRTVDVPRQCVFGGSTNQDEYLKDPTGNRRYWPVWCAFVDLPGLTSVRDQLWAEAYQLYLAGEAWWPQKSEQAMFEAEQDQRFAVDMWEPRIVTWLEQNPCESVTGDVVLEKALNLDAGHWDKPSQMRVGQILHRIGWKRRRLPATRPHGIRGYGYFRPESWKPRGQIALAEREPVL